MFKKIQVISDVWDHHRSGWKYVMHHTTERFSSPRGLVKCYGYLDGMFYANRALEEPWIGFVHNPPFRPDEYPQKYAGCYFLAELIRNPLWQESYKNCLGLYTLCSYTKRYLLDQLGADAKINVLTHPTETVPVMFDIDRFLCNRKKKIAFIGHWMRKLHSIYNIPTKTYDKVIYNAKHHSHDIDYKEMMKYVTRDRNKVEIADRIPDDEYDLLLSENLAFVDFYDTAANNVVVECIVRNHPLLVNRLLASEEYLGKKYPLYFDTLEEAADKAEDMGLIREAHEYLVALPKERFSIERFLGDMAGSEIYRDLPVNKSIVMV